MTTKKHHKEAINNDYPEENLNSQSYPSHIQNDDKMDINSNIANHPLDSEIHHEIDYKPRKKGHFFRNFFGSIFAIVILLAILIYPFANQSILAFALDASGLHKEAMYVDVLTKKAIPLAVTNNNNGNVGSYLSSISALDVSKPESCRQVWNLNNINLKSFSEQGNDGFASVQTTGKSQDWIKGSAFYSGQASLNKAYLDANFNGQLDVKADNLAQKQKEIQKDNSLSDADIQRFVKMGTISGVLNFQGLADLDKFYLNLDKISLGSNVFDLGFNFKYADQNYLSDKQKQSISGILDGFKELLDINSKDLLSASSGQDLMELYCQKISSIKVLSPTNKDFAEGQNKTTKNVRPIQIAFKDSLNDAEKTKAKTLVRNIVFDSQLKSSIKSKYESFKKIYNSQKDLFPEAKSSSNEANSGSVAFNNLQEKTNYIQSSYNKTWSENGLNKLDFTTQNSSDIAQNNNELLQDNNSSSTDLDKVFSSKAEFEKYVDAQFNQLKEDDKNSQGTSFIKDLETFLGIYQDNSIKSDESSDVKTTTTFYLDMANQNFYGSEIAIEIKSKKSGNGNLFEEITQDPMKIIIQSYNQKVTGEVTPKSIPDKVK